MKYFPVDDEPEEPAKSIKIKQIKDKPIKNILKTFPNWKLIAIAGVAIVIILFGYMMLSGTSDTGEGWKFENPFKCPDCPACTLTCSEIPDCNCAAAPACPSLNMTCPAIIINTSQSLNSLNQSCIGFDQVLNIKIMYNSTYNVTGKMNFTSGKYEFDESVLFNITNAIVTKIEVVVG